MLVISLRLQSLCDWTLDGFLLAPRKHTLLLHFPCIVPARTCIALVNNCTAILLFFFLLCCVMDVQYEEKLRALAQEQKEAKMKAVRVQREIRKHVAQQRKTSRKVKGLTSQQLYAAAERAKVAETSATSR